MIATILKPGHRSGFLCSRFILILNILHILQLEHVFTWFSIPFSPVCFALQPTEPTHTHKHATKRMVSRAEWVDFYSLISAPFYDNRCVGSPRLCCCCVCVYEWILFVSVCVSVFVYLINTLNSITFTFVFIYSNV